MAQYYKLVGSQDPTSRIDRVEVERPSEDYPSGKVLELNGDPVELSNDQVSKISSFVRLEPTDAPEGDPVENVQQPGVNLPSRSTDPIQTADVDSLKKDELQALVPDAPASATKDDLKKTVRERRGEEGAE
jgi:hypothetical protein